MTNDTTSLQRIEIQGSIEWFMERLVFANQTEASYIGIVFLDNWPIDQFFVGDKPGYVRLLAPGEEFTTYCEPTQIDITGDKPATVRRTHHREHIAINLPYSGERIQRHSVRMWSEAELHLDMHTYGKLREMVGLPDLPEGGAR